MRDAPGGMPPNPSYVVALEKLNNLCMGQKLGHRTSFPTRCPERWRYN